MKQWIDKSFFVLAVSTLGACASNPTQEAALLLVDQVDTYQGAIEDKLKAETEFYKDIRSALKDAAVRQAWFQQEVETRNRITQLTDRAIVQDKGLQVSILQQFLRDENAFARERREAEQQRRAEIEQNYRVSFETLTIKQRELSVTRAQLLELTRDRDAKKQLVEQVREAVKLANRLDEEARTTGTGDGNDAGGGD